MNKVKDYLFSGNLKDVDTKAFDIIHNEDNRQEGKIVLIASESICPPAVREAMGSSFTNKYAEGYPSLRMTKEEEELALDYERQLSFYRRYGDRRHYKGCEFVNFIEILAQKRCSEVFATKKYPANDLWVNVQPLSGAAANNAVYNAFVLPGETVMGMALNNGGHLTHGSEFNRSGKNFNVIAYEVDPKTQQFNYDKIIELARTHKPKMIIAGASAYPWVLDWSKFREAADAAGPDTILLADIAHTAGLVVGGVYPNPIDFADVVSFTTHKTLCGPRGAVLITKTRAHSRKIDLGVFPGEQGGPHIHSIAGKAVIFKLAQTKEYKALQQNIIKNCSVLAKELQDNGLTLAYGGTNSHLLLIDLNKIDTGKNFPIKGDIVANILNNCGIICNKNTIPGDENASHSSAIRLGTTIPTQRGMGEKEMKELAKLISRIILNIKSFHVYSANAKKGRGKIDLEIMIDTRKKIFELVSRFSGKISPDICITPSTPLAKKLKENDVEIGDIGNSLAGTKTKNIDQSFSSFLIDDFASGIIEVEGCRAPHFLDTLFSNDIWNLKPGRCSSGLFLDYNSEVIADCIVINSGKNKFGLDRYQIIPNPSSAFQLRLWLEAMSDGYAFIDNDDIYTKAYGPVAIRDLRFTSIEKNQKYSFIIFGNNADTLIKEIFNGKHPDPDQIISTTINKINIEIANIQHNGFNHFRIIFPMEKGVELFNLIKKLNVQLVGYDVLNQKRKEYGLPDYNANNARGKYSVKQAASLINLTNTYFVGYKPVFQELSIEDKNKKAFKWTEDTKTPPLRSCLYEEHLGLTKKKNIVPFAGWEMPVLYTSILTEHEIVRNFVGLFDVTHMGVLEISGECAEQFLEFTTVNYVGRLKPGQCQYSYLLDPNANVIDDILVYKRAEEKYMVVVNAANNDKDLAWLHAVNEGNVIIDNEFPSKQIPKKVTIKNLKEDKWGKDRKVDIALQGPNSLPLLMKLAENKKLASQISDLDPFEFIETSLQGFEMLISRTGYTGEEFGYELYVHPDDAPKIWRLLLEEGKPFGIGACGLGARDSARTEAGLPLYGHELAGDYNIFPTQVGYGSFVKRHKPFFIGKSALLKKEDEMNAIIVRFRMEDSGIRVIKPGSPVISGKGMCIGYVTSCVLVGNQQVGMALIEKKYTRVDSRISIFPKGTGSKKNQIAISDKIKEGDKVVVPFMARIIYRFLSEERALQKN